MDELLQKLLEAEVLSADTKNELQEQITTQLDEAVATQKAETEVAVRSELQEQWIEEKAALVEALDQKMNEVLESEVSELIESVNSFRDLEVEYSAKLVEARAELRTELKSDLKNLVESLDSFLEMRITAEVKELKEDLIESKRRNLGQRVLEAFGDEFKALNMIDGGDDYASQLSEMSDELENTKSKLNAANDEHKKIKRSAKMNKLLGNLKGKTKDIMEAILKNVPMEKLDEGFETYLPRIMKESDQDTSEKETQVLAEAKKADILTKKKDLDSAVSKSGDGEMSTKTPTKSKLDENAEFQIWKKLAGVEVK